MAALRWRNQSAGASSQVVPLTAGLAAAAITELLILRTFTRTAIHIPALEPLQGPYEVLSFVGRYAYFVSVALVVTALPVLVYSLARDRRRGWRIGTAAIVLFALAATLAVAGTAGRMTTDLLTLVAVVSLAAVVTGRWHTAASLPLAMFGLAFITGGGYTALQSTSQSGAESTDLAWMLTVAEYAGVLFALSFPLVAKGHMDRWSLVVGGVFAALAFMMFAGEGASTSRILLLWNEGLSGTLPGTVYAVCAGTLAASFVALVRSGQLAAAVGLTLLVAGGLGLHNTYQSGLVIAGLAVLSLAGPAGLAVGGTTASDRSEPLARFNKLLTP